MRGFMPHFLSVAVAVSVSAALCGGCANSESADTGSADAGESVEGPDAQAESARDSIPDDLDASTQDPPDSDPSPAVLDDGDTRAQHGEDASASASDADRAADGNATNATPDSSRDAHGDTGVDSPGSPDAEMSAGSDDDRGAAMPSADPSGSGDSPGETADSGDADDSADDAGADGGGHHAGSDEPTRFDADPADAEQVITVDVRGGDPVGGHQRVKVRLGSVAALKVTSDISEEVHVHAYDILRSVSAGHPAHFAFTASIPGVFEVELERSGRLLVRLEVS